MRVSHRDESLLGRGEAVGVSATRHAQASRKNLLRRFEIVSLRSARLTIFAKWWLAVEILTFCAENSSDLEAFYEAKEIRIKVAERC